MRLVITFLIAFCLLTSTVCQDWSQSNEFDAFDGAQLPHVFADKIHIQDGTAIDFTETYTLTIPEGIFSATENIYITVGLLSLDMDIASGDRTLFVESAEVNAAKTEFSLTLRNQEDSPGATATPYTQVQYSILLIGSDFQGFSNTLESSYIYGKMGDLETVNPAETSKHFKFDTGDGSPFDYVPDADLGQGCGMIRKNGNIIIELSLCEHSQLYLIIAGYAGTIETTGTPPELTLSSTIYDDLALTAAFPTPSDALFKSSNTDTDFGPVGNYDGAGSFTLFKIQLSFIFIGIRNYDVNNYPNQPSPEDGFLFYAKSSDEPTEGTFGGGQLTIGVQDPFQNIGNFAHIFCGLDYLDLTDGQDAISSVLDDIQPGDTEIPIDITGTTTSPQIVCLVIRSREICEQTQNVLVLVPTSDRIQIQSNFGVTAVASGTQLAGPKITPTLKFQFQPAQNADNTMTTTMKFDRSNGDTAFYATILIPNLEAGDYVKITIFGEVVFQQMVGGTSLVQQFYLVSNDVSQNEIVIQFSGTHASAPAGSEVLSVGILSYDNILNGIQCVNQCPPQENMDVGINNDNPPSCIYCDTTLFMDYDHEQRECKCLDGYVDNSGTCEPCYDILCALCADSTTTADCTLCVPHATEDGSGVCNCDDGFYADGRSCVPCLHACVDCSSETVCSSCEPNDNTRDTAANGCVCLDGYYEDGVNAICPECSVECLTCEDEASKCTSCQTAGNFELVGTTCKCKDGYYELRTDTDATCEKCDDTCLTCETSSLQCTSCDEENAFRQLTGDKKCECMDGFAEIMGECIDQDCQTVTPHCQSCAYDPLTQTSECLDCTANRYLLNQVCVCKVGFYEASGNCEPCGTGCQECQLTPTNDLICLSCALKSIQNPDGTCTCPAGTILVEASGAMYCRKCSSNCRKCEGTYDYCTQCSDPLINNNNGQCICPQKTYPSSGGQCLPCVNNCNKCTDGSTCDQCESGYVWDGTKCDLNCPDGTYKNADTCKDCPDGCNTCLNEYHCKDCEDGFYLYAGCCRDYCPSGTFVHNGHCYGCVSPCKTCSGSGENCESCISTKVYFNGKCIKDCPDGTYFGDGSCLLCDPRCLTCTGTSTYCKSCFDNQYLFDHKCFDECPGVITETGCSGSCPDGKYIYESTCKDCDEKCGTCSGSATNCLTCANGFKSHNGDCVESCPQNYLDKGTFCVKCSECCYGCSGTIDFCDKCSPGYVKIGKKCTNECPKGQYIDYKSHSCKYCGEGCKICTSLAHCVACIDPTLTPVHGICKKGCPIGAKLIGDKCICTFGYSHLNVCVSSCPERFYAYNKKCEPCQSPCKSCSGTPYHCLNCEDGYKFDPSTSTCSRKSKCNYGEYEDYGGGCRRLCSVNQCFYQTACLSFCPSGYQNNGYGGCVEITNPSICSYPQYQQGSSCVSACQVGYYGNDATRQCEKCGSYCFLCLKHDHCLQCLPEYVPVDGLCVKSLGCNEYQVQYKGKCCDGCPIGTYRSGVTCKPACEKNRYYYNGFCYSDCPTNHHTDEACIN